MTGTGFQRQARKGLIYQHSSIMNWRERLGNWISGGLIMFYRNGWDRSAAYHIEARQAADSYEGALVEIAAMETPGANATVKRMAKVARQELGQ